MAALAPVGVTPAAKRNDYITDGKHLVMVRRKMATGSWLVEDTLSDPELPTLSELSADDLCSGLWRKVKLVELPDV